MNKITSANILCRERFSGLEVIDFGSNKLADIPVAMPKFLVNLTQLIIINNDVQKLPNMLGLHKKIKNISVEGNPLKSIRRPIIAKGSAGIL
jgi:Leucine-rich repeat (LRR) protein